MRGEERAEVREVSGEEEERREREFIECICSKIYNCIYSNCYYLKSLQSSSSNSSKKVIIKVTNYNLSQILA